jgi:hypothetical protein
MTDRPHLYRVLEDADGNPLRGASYSILSASGGAFNGSLFQTNDGTATFPATGTTETGVIDCYFGAPARIILQFTPVGSVQATAATIDVEAPYSFGLPADLAVTNVPQAAGNVLTAIDADTASWQPPTGGGGGGGTTVDPSDASTVPTDTYLKDANGAVWEVSVGTDGSLTTTVYERPPFPVSQVIVGGDVDGMGNDDTTSTVQFTVADYDSANDSFSFTYTATGTGGQSEGGGTITSANYSGPTIQTIGGSIILTYNITNILNENDFESVSGSSLTVTVVHQRTGKPNSAGVSGTGRNMAYFPEH